MRRNALIPSVAFFVGLALFSKEPAKAASCESLASLSTPQTTITLAQPVAAGAFTPPKPLGRPGGPPLSFSHLPAFCRVAATVRPASGSEIKVEVWMPDTGWNGKLQSVGNGAFAGTISYPAMEEALLAGYATASTDTGHTEDVAADFLMANPEELIDFAYRAIHEMTVSAKLIIAARYGNDPQYAYFNGCSTGGRQALTEAQRYPADYNGIIAGAPANYTTNMTIGQLFIGRAVEKNTASYIPPAKYPAIHQAVLNACDALDGVKDGVIENPKSCHFDPKALECKDGDTASCLTAPQVEAARLIYSGAKNPRTGKQIFPGLEPGSELGWGAFLAGPKPFEYAVATLKYEVFKDPNWQPAKLNFDSDVAFADKTAGGMMNAIDPNLKPFFSRGGKLLMYQGWADPGIPPQNSVNYYTSVVDTLGGPGKVEDAIRLFMVPGMGHCGGGPGTDSFDKIGALDHWVAEGAAPAEIIAAHKTHGIVDRTRPLCPYPQVAAYKGTGSTDQASNFTCKTPR